MTATRVGFLGATFFVRTTRRMSNTNATAKKVKWGSGSLTCPGGGHYTEK